MPGAWVEVKITSLELGDLFLKFGQGFVILNKVKDYQAFPAPA